MSYLTVIRDKGYQEYIDDVARGLEAEEQRKLSLEGEIQKTPDISIGKILLICVALMISTSLIFVAIAVSLHIDKGSEVQTVTNEEIVVPEQNIWNCNGKYTNYPTDDESCTLINDEDVVAEDGTRSITPNAPKN